MQEKKHKPTKVEVEERVRIVKQLLLSSLSRTEIIHYAAQKWHIGLRQTSTYIKRAYDQFEAERNPKDHHRRIAMRWDIAKRCLAKGQERVAWEIIRDLDALEGYYKQLQDDGKPRAVDYDYEEV